MFDLKRKKLITCTSLAASSGLVIGLCIAIKICCDLDKVAVYSTGTNKTILETINVIIGFTLINFIGPFAIGYVGYSAGSYLCSNNDDFFRIETTLRCRTKIMSVFLAFILGAVGGVSSAFKAHDGINRSIDCIRSNGFRRMFSFYNYVAAPIIFLLVVVFTTACVAGAVNVGMNGCNWLAFRLFTNTRDNRNATSDEEAQVYCLNDVSEVQANARNNRFQFLPPSDETPPPPYRIAISMRSPNNSM